MAWKKYYKKSAKYGSNSKKRAIGNSKAAANQRDALTVCIKYAEEVTFSNDTGANSDSITMTRNMYAVLKDSPMYAAFQGMYDQIKLESAKVKAKQTWSNSTYQNPNSPLKLVTAWDRTGLSTIDGNIVVPNYEKVCQSSSAFTGEAYYGTVWKSTRKIYPALIEEKGQYVSTANLASTSTTSTNPTTSMETGIYKFKPTYLLSVKPQTQINNGESVCKIQLDYEIIVTFRGLRKIN